MERRNKIILATDNAGKLQEFRQLLQPLELDVVPQSQFNISSAAETGLTFVENALLKARHACTYAHLPALADDSGLVVDSLEGAPGIYSARYAGKDATAEKNISKLLMTLQAVAPTQRQAYFYCVLVYLRYPQDPSPLICEGRWQGEILLEPQGANGFGYDPIFYVPAHQCSAAQLSMSVKNSISHRAQAVQSLLKKLAASGNVTPSEL